MAVKKKTHKTEVVTQFLKQDQTTISNNLESVRIKILELVSSLKNNTSQNNLCFTHRIFIGLFATLVELNLLNTDIKTLDKRNYNTLIIRLINNTLNINNTSLTIFTATENNGVKLITKNTTLTK